MKNAPPYNDGINNRQNDHEWAKPPKFKKYKRTAEELEKLRKECRSKHREELDDIRRWEEATRKYNAEQEKRKKQNENPGILIEPHPQEKSEGGADQVKRTKRGKH